MAKAQTGNIDRRTLLLQLFPNFDEWLFVSGLAGFLSGFETCASVFVA